MKSLRSLPILALAFACLGPRADVLELKNGQIYNGKYVGGTAGTVRFETTSGVQVIPTADIIALTFTSSGGTAAAPAPSTAPAQATAPSSAPAQQTPASTASAPPKSVTLPAGTMLLVRLMDAVSSKNKPGTPFATKLEYDLAAGGAVALKGGTIIHGKVQSSSQAGRVRGRSTLDLRLTQIVIAGRPVPLVSSGYKQASQASIAKAAKGAAAGAAIGAIADGGDGAGTGAAIGATAGAMMRGQTITVAPGTLLEFTLQQPVTVQSTN